MVRKWKGLNGSAHMSTAKAHLIGFAGLLWIYTALYVSFYFIVIILPNRWTLGGKVR